ncbi:mannitol dehydrogenase family protein [Pseudogemmobacter sp. W21_MBD1_M6]|uniref:mannitol dehydrogenase family protein n=1 Tax=Pseudogemmobacter sp. W21_MBD1_M6 TaxID=3240271 RepID=UPI003F9CE483
MEAGLPAEFPRLTASGQNRPGLGIVHLGLGAFFRAHGAVYIAEAMAASGGDWGIVGVSLQNPTMRDALVPQGCAYTVLTLGPDGDVPQVMNAVQDVLVARENPEQVLGLLADPRIRIVTLTVTEKGYCHEPSTGALNRTHPDIVHDIANPLPVSALGYLVRGMQRRRDAGLPPFTVMTCDNLPENGSVVRGVVLDLARAIDPALADWIKTKGRFPSTMVDRIVPATKPGDIDRQARMTGQLDLAPVMAEPFRQWVVEDNFVNDARPDLGAVGVQLVPDVTAFEHMKLRMLNGTHSSLAYLGYLAGHETISDAMADPVFQAYVRRLWANEIIPALTPPAGEDLNAYAEALFKRYSNPAIRHRTWQIAMDGSQKLPQRILGTLTDNLKAGRASPGLILAVAAWMRYVGGVDEGGNPIEVKDPLAARLRAVSDGQSDAGGKVAALLSLSEIFPSDLARALKPELTEAYLALVRSGARRTIEGGAA